MFSKSELRDLRIAVESSPDMPLTQLHPDGLSLPRESVLGLIDQAASETGIFERACSIFRRGR